MFFINFSVLVWCCTVCLFLFLPLMCCEFQLWGFIYLNVMGRNVVHARFKRSYFYLQMCPFRPCCQSASLQSWRAPSRPAQSHETSTLPLSSLVLELPQWVWLALELVLEPFSAASSLATPGRVLNYDAPALHRIGDKIFNSPHTSKDAHRSVLKLLRGIFEKCNGWLRWKLGCPHKSYIHQRTWDPRKKQLSYARTETLLDCGPALDLIQTVCNPEVSWDLL